MTRLLIVAALAGLTATAVAQPAELALGAAQLDLAPRRDLLSEEATGPYWRGAAFAQLAAGTASPVDVGVGAAAALSGIGCDLISGAVQGRLRPQVRGRGRAGPRWPTFAVAPSLRRLDRAPHRRRWRAVAARQPASSFVHDDHPRTQRGPTAR
jgi:hypothetical protein